MSVTASDNALTTVADVKYVWGRNQDDTGDDDRIQTLINLISDRVENWCGRKFKQTTYTDEAYDGNGDKILFLKQYPIISVIEIKQNNAILSPDYYKVYKEEGFLKNDYGWVRGSQNYNVTYTAGYPTIPKALEGIVIEWVIMLLEGRMKDAKVDSSDMSNLPDSLMLGLASFQRRDF